MRLVDLTHSMSRQEPVGANIPVVVRSQEAINRVALDQLVTLATVVELPRASANRVIDRGCLTSTGLSGIAGCILYTGWSDDYYSGRDYKPPRLSMDAAEVLLSAGVSTVAADFPVTTEAADLLLHNHCVLVYCLSGIAELREEIVRIVALPLKFEDTYSADARVIALEE